MTLSTHLPQNLPPVDEQQSEHSAHMKTNTSHWEAVSEHLTATTFLLDNTLTEPAFGKY